MFATPVGQISSRSTKIYFRILKIITKKDFAVSGSSIVLAYLLI